MRYQLIKLLPKNLLSRMAGVLADTKLPSPLLQSFLKGYIKFYQVRLEEVEHPVDRMKNFTEFFTRSLKEGARPIDPTPKGVVSPVDGKLAQFGPITDGLLTQTKGVFYSLVDLVGESMAAEFLEGYFLTLYLSPADYHRIHAPVAGTVRRFSYFSGQLWPVNNIGIRHVAGLFSVNERLITPLESPAGLVAVIKVGATVVGKITTAYSGLTSNSGHSTVLNLPIEPPRQFQKGQELAQFQLGSTVILLFQKGRFTPEALEPGQKVRMGQLIGHWADL